jgi:phage baseplate assembly protein W
MGATPPVRETASMRGIDANTGKSLAGIEHLRQSVRDILTTPIGSRVLRRDYGSQLFSLIDAPLNRSSVMDLYAATADALDRWEPRFRVTKVQATMPTPGVVLLDLTGIYLPEGIVITLDGIEVS